MSRALTLLPTRWPTYPCRGISTTAICLGHENPLGLPRNNQRAAPSMPRRSSGPPQPRPIPHVKRVLAVSSAKGGVGKSTVAANLALALSMQQVPVEGSSGSTTTRAPRVGLLDLDIFGPSVPILMGLQGLGEPELSESELDVSKRKYRGAEEAGALLPLTNHGVPCMSMGFLLPDASEGASPVVWRGLMVMKAVQQLLFDVDWRGVDGHARSAGQETAEDGLDCLVIDMPPGTGDVALSLTQLVKVDGAVVVSTPQEVALADARKGVAMFDKVNVPISGLVLNMAHFTAPDTGKHYPLFGPPEAFDAFAKSANAPILARLPLEAAISAGGDAGQPIVLKRETESSASFQQMAAKLWPTLK